MVYRFLSVCITFFFLINISAQSIELVSKFDTRLMKYYKVDTCRMYETVKSGNVKTKYLTKIYLFNSEGNISKEVEFDIRTHDIIQTILYSYNGDQNIVRKEIRQSGRESVIFDYQYYGGKWVGMTTTYPYYKEYEVQSTESGLILGIIGKAQTQELDPITYEPTGKEVLGKIEEYEYRYNRYNKIVKENYYYMDRPISTSIYQFPPNGYGAPLSKKFFKVQGTDMVLDSLKTPLTYTTYSYNGTGFLEEESTKDAEEGTSYTLSYEYAFSYDSPINQYKPKQKVKEKFWLGKNKGQE
ncbi:MAG: hypothetical protein M9887_09280 [Chitinophagales bacterium]|nr:hypothetical protein [Chitinophagales bacterium]